MKKVILLIIALTFLSGCGIYNLNGFVMPDDLEFLAVVESLDTPLKIGDYMAEHFEYEEHLLRALSPHELFVEEKGDCNDFALFGAYIDNYHGYTVYQININWVSSGCHYLGVYDEESDMYSFTDNRTYFCYFNNFRDIVNHSSKIHYLQWKSYKVMDYEGNVKEKGYF